MNVDEFYATLDSNINNYLVINNALSEKDLQACISVADSLYQNPKFDDDENPYYGDLVEPKEIFDDDHLFSNIDPYRVAEIYGIEHLDRYVWEIAADGESFFNDFHNDVKYYKHHVTLQWYLVLDDETRKFHISNQFGNFEHQPKDATIEELNTVSNTMLAFTATPTSFHGFKAGTGRRYNVRLRLFEGLQSPNRIQNLNLDDKTCWLIDTKGMDVSTAIPNFERYLSRFTYNSLLAANQHNILCLVDNRKYSDILKRFQQLGFEKCVVVMAGTCVERKAIEWVNTTDQYHTYGELFDDSDYFLRKVTVINLNMVESLDISGRFKYLHELVEGHKPIKSDELGFTYVHPEIENWYAYYNVAERSSSDPDFLKFKEMSPKIDRQDFMRLTKMAKYTAEHVLPFFKQPQVKTLTLTPR